MPMSAEDPRKNADMVMKACPECGGTEFFAQQACRGTVTVVAEVTEDGRPFFVRNAGKGDAFPFEDLDFDDPEGPFKCVKCSRIADALRAAVNKVDWFDPEDAVRELAGQVREKDGRCFVARRENVAGVEVEKALSLEEAVLALSRYKPHWVRTKGGRKAMAGEERDRRRGLYGPEYEGEKF